MSTRTIRIISVGLLVGACAPVPPFTDAERQAVATEVTAALAEFTEAINDHDSERVVTFYSDSPEFYFLGCTSSISGGTTFKQMIGPTYRPERGATFEKHIVSLQVLSPTAAVVSQRGRSSRAPALFWTRVLVKQDGRWVITYEHQSWPDCDPPLDPHPYTMPSDSAGLLPESVSR